MESKNMKFFVVFALFVAWTKADPKCTINGMEVKNFDKYFTDLEYSFQGNELTISGLVIEAVEGMGCKITVNSSGQTIVDTEKDCNQPMDMFRQIGCTEVEAADTSESGNALDKGDIKVTCTCDDATSSCPNGELDVHMTGTAKDGSTVADIKMVIDKTS